MKGSIVLTSLAIFTFTLAQPARYMDKSTLVAQTATGPPWNSTCVVPAESDNPTPVPYGAPTPCYCTGCDDAADRLKVQGGIQACTPDCKRFESCSRLGCYTTIKQLSIKQVNSMCSTELVQGGCPSA